METKELMYNKSNNVNRNYNIGQQKLRNNEKGSKSNQVKGEKYTEKIFDQHGKNIRYPKS